GVLDVDHIELSSSGYGKSDANQSAADQQAVGLPASIQCRCVEIVAVGAIVGTKDRIQTPCRFESVSNMRSRNRPCITGPVTGTAATPIRAEALEKRPGEVHLSGRAERFYDSSRVLKGREIREKPVIGHNH